MMSKKVTFVYRLPRSVVVGSFDTNHQALFRWTQEQWDAAAKGEMVDGRIEFAEMPEEQLFKHDMEIIRDVYFDKFTKNPEIFIGRKCITEKFIEVLGGVLI